MPFSQPSTPLRLYAARHPFLSPVTVDLPRRPFLRFQLFAFDTLAFTILNYLFNNSNDRLTPSIISSYISQLSTDTLRGDLFLCLYHSSLFYAHEPLIEREGVFLVHVWQVERCLERLRFQSLYRRSFPALFDTPSLRLFLGFLFDTLQARI